MKISGLTSPRWRRAGHAARLDYALLAVCAVAFGVAIFYPTLRLAIDALRAWDWETLSSGQGFEAVLNTIVISFLSVLFAGVLGAGLALLVTRCAFPGRRTLSALAYLPFALPPLVGTLSFYYLIGRDGLFPRWIEAGFGIADPGLSGPAAILIIHAYSFSVFFYAMAVAALERMDISQVEAARTLGAGPWRTFRTVTIPYLKPALLGAALLTFMSSGASFSAPLYFGGDFPMLSVRIYEARTQLDHAGALTLSVALAGVSFLGVALFGARRPASGTGVKGAPRPLRSPGARILVGLGAWLAIVLLLLPHLTILWFSFVDHRAWHTELIPPKLTLDHYATIFGDPASFRPIRNSAWMSAFAAAACLGIGLPAAYLIGRQRPGGGLVNAVMMIPWALPGTVVAMNLIVAFNEDWAPLYDTIWMLPLAYFVRFIPLLGRMATAAVAQFDAGLIEAGRTLGATPRFCFVHVILPILTPALLAATALVFASALGEFVATILLYTPANLPISIGIDMRWRGATGGVGGAFAYSVFLMVLVTITFGLARRFASRVI